MKPDRLAFVVASVLLSLGLAAAETVVPLWPEGVPNGRTDLGEEVVNNDRVENVHKPSLTLFLPDAGKANGTAVIICPGGSYTRLAFGHEGIDIAKWFNARGVTAFVLKYRMKEYGHPAPLQDVLRAVRIVRSRAAEFGTKPDRIGVVGSSAGGHLAASAGTLYDQPAGKTGAPLDAVNARPDFLVLLYPVISMDPAIAHAGSRQNLIGASPSPDLVELMSLENQVTDATPPTFIFYTQEDKTVPVENGVRFFQSLTRHKVPAEFHIFERGPHGLGLRSGFGPTSDWPKLAEAWLQLHGWIAGTQSQP